MGDEALSIGADTFQFFSRNPRGSGVRKLDVDDIQALNQLMAAHHFAPILAHAPYTLNGCSKTAKTRDFARQAMADDLRRLEYVDNCRYNFHPGSHVGQGAETGIASLPTCSTPVCSPARRRRSSWKPWPARGRKWAGPLKNWRPSSTKWP